MPGTEAGRPASGAWVPPLTPGLKGLMAVNTHLLAFGQQQALQTQATLYLDATLVPTRKASVQYSYQKCKAFQPLPLY